MTPTSDPWHVYRRGRRLLLAGFLAGLALFAASFPVAKAWQSDRPLYVGLALFLGAAALGLAPLNSFLCPKCGEPFIHKGRQRNVFTRRCLNCRHPRWADPG
ncbi:MAG: hypothetical protein ABSH53_06365 [Holophaga sp.]|jgi:hypothetical protein